MFIASALILPAGISYAAYGPGFTTGTPTVQPMANQTNVNQNMTMSTGTNQTSTHPTMNQNMTMSTGTNQTSTHPTMNQNMTMSTGTNQTSTNTAMNKTMTSANPTISPPVVAKPKMLLPLEQVKAGVAPKDVQCKSGFTLIFKAEDGSPACVDSTVAQILAQRGW